MRLSYKTDLRDRKTTSFQMQRTETEPTLRSRMKSVSCDDFGAASRPVHRLRAMRAGWLSRDRYAPMSCNPREGRARRRVDVFMVTGSTDWRDRSGTS